MKNEYMQAYAYAISFLYTKTKLIHCRSTVISNEHCKPLFLGFLAIFLELSLSKVIHLVAEKLEPLILAARYSLAPVAKCVQEKLGKPVTFLKASPAMDGWTILP